MDSIGDGTKASLSCQNPGCFFIAKNCSGIGSHSTRCPLKRSSVEVLQGTDLTPHVRRRQSLPRQLGGSGPRLPYDAMVSGFAAEGSFMHHRERQQEVCNDSRDVERSGSGPQAESPILNSSGASEAEEFLKEGPGEVSEALALLLSKIEQTIGARDINDLLKLIQHPAYSPENCKEKFSSAKELQNHVSETLTRVEEDLDLEAMGFESREIKEDSGASCTAHVRSPLSLLRQQLAESSRHNMLYDSVTEFNRFGDRVVNHPLSGLLAKEGIPLTVKEIKGSPHVDAM